MPRTVALAFAILLSFPACDSASTSVTNTEARKDKPGNGGDSGGEDPGGEPPAGCFADVAPLHDGAFVPRDSTAVPDVPTGPIGVLFVGASTTHRVADETAAAYATEAGRNSDVTFVTGSVSAQLSEAWADAGHRVWSKADRAVTGAGLTTDHVQVLFVKSFSEDEPTVAGQSALISQIIDNAAARYPNLSEVYLLDEGYGGWASREPDYHTTGQVVLDVVSRRAGTAPFVAAGAYLWADGLGPDCAEGGVAGRADGLEWTEADFTRDGFHPTDVGGRKMASLVLQALAADPVASRWAFPNGR